MMETLLAINNLAKHFPIPAGGLLRKKYNILKAVDGVSFSIDQGETLGIVGESGSGKSTVAHAILRLIAPPGRIAGGEIFYQDHDLLELEDEEMIRIRGAEISMIFQDPFTSLNPVFTVGEQIGEAVQLHQKVGRKEARERAIDMLEKVKIRDASSRVNDYPHQFSGGMRQRVMIAMALACRPKLLIADEPTTALDVTVQAEILRLLKELREQMGLSILYITHNFGIVNELCDRVAVMHQGRLVEEGPTWQIIDWPKEAYTVRPINSVRELAKR